MTKLPDDRENELVELIAMGLAAGVRSTAFAAWLPDIDDRQPVRDAFRAQARGVLAARDKRRALDSTTTTIAVDTDPITPADADGPRFTAPAAGVYRYPEDMAPNDTEER